MTKNQIDKETQTLREEQAIVEKAIQWWVSEIHSTLAKIDALEQKGLNSEKDEQRYEKLYKKLENLWVRGRVEGEILEKLQKKVKKIQAAEKKLKIK